MSKYITIYDFFSSDEGQRLTHEDLVKIGEELNQTAMNVNLLIDYSLLHRLIKKDEDDYYLNLDTEE